MSKNKAFYLTDPKVFFAAFILILTFSVQSFSQPELPWKVVSSGGTNATSGALKLRGTIGQTATTFSTAGSLDLHAGFWQNFGALSGCCIGIKGDFNGDGTDNGILDLNFLVNDIFRGGPSATCPEETDLNGDGQLAGILDLNFMVNDIFRGGPSPGPCASVLSLVPLELPTGQKID